MISEDTFALLAFAGSLAILGLLYWSRTKSKSVGEALHRLAEERSTLRSKPSREDFLRQALEELSSAERLLSEVSSIGLWMKSDDSSDNRRRRSGLREADWAVSAAYRALNSLESESLTSRAQEAHQIVQALEPLPDTIPDTMGDNPALDLAVRTLADQVEALRGRVEAVLAEGSDEDRSR